VKKNPSKLKLLMSGNEAMAEGAIQSGCFFYAGYPITPQNELTAYMAKRMPEARGIFIQAESELAAINMVFGASAAGARALTSSSSPGISLKQEGISYLAGCELPAVIINVMRGGPGLGNISPSQSDYFQAVKGGGHGDYHSIVLAPSSVQEAYDFMPIAFELADRYRTPVIVLGDGLLGQMMEPLLVSQKPEGIPKLQTPSSLPDRQAGKLQTKAWALTGCKDRAPNVIRSLLLADGALEKFNLTLQKKYDVIKNKEQRYEGLFLDDARIVLVAYGSMARIAKSVVHKLRRDGKKIGLLRPMSLWPFPEKIFRKLTSGNSKLKTLLTIEMSYGQMLEDVKLSVSNKAKVEFLGRAGGGISTEKEIMKKVNSLTR
jgi:2-oxoglutarate ferredoxin oxidoreductase subunit alpha